VPPFSEGTDNPQKLAVVDFVSSFGRVEGFGKEADGVSFSCGVHLGEDGARGVFRRVGLDLEGPFQVGHHKDRFFGEFLFEEIERVIDFEGPLEWDPFL
jgi:hypothetical protein